VAAHFPLPYAEIAADIVTGRIDAIEAQALSPDLDDPTIVEWYRFLNAGHRLPILGGTDKMSAEVPVGAVRTYARMADDGPLTFDGWAGAVRSGRTFVTSGPILDLALDGHELGDVIRLPPLAGVSRREPGRGPPSPSSRRSSSSSTGGSSPRRKPPTPRPI
jgi:hypothetical protein